MSYSEMTSSEKTLLSSLLLKKLGTSRGKYFTVTWDNDKTILKCEKTRVDWKLEKINVFFRRLNHTENELSVFQIAFFEDLVIGFDPKLIQPAKKESAHQKKAKLEQKRTHIPQTVSQVITQLRNLGAYQAVNEIDITRREHDYILKTLGMVIGILENLPRERSANYE